MNDEMSTLPTFAEFYEALHEREPFPWQIRLAEEVTDTGRWRDEIGVHTGLGKTACIDIAVWALAAQAHLHPAKRTAPTRTWYVVNRRLLVDAAHERAEELARKLRQAEEGPLAAVAERLRSLTACPSAEVGPLHVVRLRGGAPLGERPHDPTQPAVVLATVPMFASRWLFRGHGTSWRMRPVDAAHAGTDSLVLLDEAHLTPHLRRVAEHAAQCDLGDPTAVLPEQRSRPMLVALTATGDSRADRFEIGPKDRAHPVVAQRLHAAKTTRVVRIEAAKDTASTLVEEAIAALDCADVHRVLVFANTVANARATYARLAKHTGRRARPCSVVLLTGQIREHEAEQARRRITDSDTGMLSDPKRGTCDAPEADLVVVATQTLEVGADVDADALVTEACGVRALTQRLGRLNRLGIRTRADAVVVHAADLHAKARAAGTDGSGKPRGWPVYGAEPADVIERIERAARPDGTVDLCPDRIARVLGEPGDEPAAVAELLPAHLWEWAKTSCPPLGEAPAAAFYDRLDDPTWYVTVCWRAYVPHDGARIVPAVNADETVDVALRDLTALLEGTAKRRGLDLDQLPVRSLADDGGTASTIAVSEVRPWHVVLLAPEDGGHDEHGFEPSARGLVVDRSAIDSGVLSLDTDNLTHLRPSLDRDELAEALSPLAIVDDMPPDRREAEDAAAAVVALLASAPPREELDAERWRTVLDALVNSSGRPRRLILPDDGGVPRLLPERPRTRGVRIDELDELSFAVDERSLDGHLRDVAVLARRIGERLGLAAELTNAVEVAAALHDIGKIDPRFQRWLVPDGGSDTPVAKSAQPLERRERLRAAAGWPRGGRHEALSLRLLQARLGREPSPSWAGLADLVLHLVAAHHGHGRPSLSPAVDRTAVGSVTAPIDATNVSAGDDLSACDWDQPARFRRLCEAYGYWGLGLLETVVRQADHAASGAHSAEHRLS